jgi:pimeloyl-ACP methyl ester carboxylesterase
MTTFPTSELVRAMARSAVALLVISSAGCGGGADPSSDRGPASPHDSSAAAPVSSTAPAADKTSGAVETSGMYDVGGHKLFMTCAGQGRPTVVFVHGWVNDASFVPHVHASGVRDRLVADYRVCLYDRRNVGYSDTVDAVQRPEDVVREMRRVLEAGGEEPPYLLYAGSFGGLVATAYLEEHPDDVVGMLLVDTMFPDELGLDRYLPREYRFKHFDKDDKCCTQERISQYDLIRSLQDTIGEEPEIPVVYLASQQEPRNENAYESPRYDARILEAQAAYVDRFSPGILDWVDAPHFMEPVVPDVIADAVRKVDRLASQG